VHVTPLRLGVVYAVGHGGHGGQVLEVMGHQLVADVGRERCKNRVMKSRLSVISSGKDASIVYEYINNDGRGLPGPAFLIGQRLPRGTRIVGGQLGLHGCHGLRLPWATAGDF
jgi:hypothetical protein